MISPYQNVFSSGSGDRCLRHGQHEIQQNLFSTRWVSIPPPAGHLNFFSNPESFFVKPSRRAAQTSESPNSIRFFLLGGQNLRKCQKISIMEEIAKRFEEIEKRFARLGFGPVAPWKLEFWILFFFKWGQECLCDCFITLPVVFDLGIVMFRQPENTHKNQFWKRLRRDWKRLRRDWEEIHWG